MALLMTGLCEKGVELIWKQCDEEQFSRGIEHLKEAMRSGDPEALYFLGRCFNWGDGAVGFNDKKAYECYREGVRGGSYRCAFGALRAGRYDEELRDISAYSLEECYEQLRKAADQGDGFAALQIAEALEWGDYKQIPTMEKQELSVDTSEPESMESRILFWYEKAAEGGIVDGMVKAGKCHMNGKFTGVNQEKTIYYADLAAAVGNSWGLYQMGTYWEEQENPEAAFAYYQAATIQGDKQAPIHLGRMYLSGVGIDRDIKEGISALETAASRENTECLAELGDVFYRDEVVERDDERAFFWYSSAYAAGDKRTILPLAHLYMSAGDNQDIQRAEQLFTEAVKIDETGNACLELGNIYREGIGRTVDIDKAIHYYEEGSEQGNAECMEILGNLYFDGDGVEESYEKAFYWFDRLNQQNLLLSYEKLAFLYLKGYGCDADDGKAVQLFEIVSETECDGRANYELGYIYEKRNETPEDLELAAEYYERAIEMGNESAVTRFSHFRRNMFGKWKLIY